MSARIVNPQDSVSLVLLLQSFGGTIGTLYPQAHVYNNADTEVTGSPFTLTHVANNLYTLSSAFQVGDSGTYKIVYITYTDAGHTARSENHGEVVEIIEAKIQSTSGLGGYNRGGGDVIVDMDPIFKAIKGIDKKFSKQIKDIKSGLDNGFKLDMPNIPEMNTKPLLDAIEGLKTGVGGGVERRILEAIKKNRSAIIKHSFDKSMFKPMMASIADSDLRIIRSMKQLKIDLSNTIDMHNEDRKKMLEEYNENNNKKIENALNKTVGIFVDVADNLNESIRQKLKFTLDGLRTLLYTGKRSRQNFNIKINKDE